MRKNAAAPREYTWLVVSKRKRKTNVKNMGKKCREIKRKSKVERDIVLLLLLLWIRYRKGNIKEKGKETKEAWAKRTRPREKGLHKVKIRPKKPNSKTNTWVIVSFLFAIRVYQNLHCNCMRSIEAPHQAKNDHLHCSVRLTGIVFARGLSSRARAPSSCFVCEYLKEVNKGAPSRPFALRRSSQVARNIKVTHPWEVVEETVLSD